MGDSYESAAALVCTIRGATGEHLNAFVGSLIGQQYSASYVCQLAQHALAFGHWCEDSCISFHALKDHDIVRYQRLRSRRRSRCFETRRRELHALELLTRFLRDRGVCHVAQTHAIAADEVVEGFAQYLRRDQGLAVVTVESYARWTRKFLVWRFGQGEVCLRDVRVTDASAFVKSEAKRMAPAALKNVVTALRSFLRYAQFRGEVTAGLAASVPAVASWASTPPIPRAIAAEHAQRAIDSCDRRSAVGRRDRAVLLLLARLGLRACEIVRLTLDDVDWDCAQLRVRGKGGRESLLPLTADVGEAIAAYLERGRTRHAKHISTGLALEWAQNPSVQPAEWARRLCFVRGFARHRSATDIRTEIPPVGMLPHRSTRARPHLYTEAEVRRLLDAALELPVAWPSTPLRPWVFHCLIGLLSVTGLRISEALNLELGDVDLEDAVLTIRGAKLGRSRLVPIHPTTCTVLADYLRRRKQFLGRQVSSNVFVTSRGTRLDIGRVHRTFYALSRQTGLRAEGASKGPRLHDFRHRFAVEVLIRWYQSGEDAWRLLPVLSTYLGHIYVAGTYWYLSGSPELMAQAMDRLERRWGESS